MKHDWEASGSVSSDGKDKGLKSNFFQQRKLGDANANANLEPLLEEEKEEEDSVSAAILSELKTFRRENNEELTAITSAMTSLEQSVEKMGEHLTHVESRINQAEEGSTHTTDLVGYLLRCKRQLEERCEDLENYCTQGGTTCEFMGLLKAQSRGTWCSGLRHF